MEVAFKEGQIVKKGDFLAQIDPRPYQVALAQAQGQLAKDRAMLRNSEVDLARYRTLLAQNSIARQTVDTQAALVQQNQGTMPPIRRRSMRRSSISHTPGSSRRSAVASGCAASIPAITFRPAMPTASS